MKLNLANILTLLRIVLIPVLVVVFYLDWKWAHLGAAAVFLLASVTDILDGYVARTWNQGSPFGAFLDPVADKLMVSTALIIIVQADPRIFIALMAAIIVGREITVSALREWMAGIGHQSRVKVALLGKIKTIAQMTAVTLLLLRDPILGLPIYWLGVFSLAVASVLTLWSMVSYLRAAWPSIRQNSG